MANKSSIPTRLNPKFTEGFIKDIQIKRIKMGKDNPLKPTPPSRISLAIARHPLSGQIKKDIIEADLR